MNSESIEGFIQMRMALSGVLLAAYVLRIGVL